MRFTFLSLVILFIVSCTRKPVVFQTDFGLKDAAVAEMKGVALSIDPSLQLFDLTHDIPPFNTWEAAYRLNQAATYWPAGTIFVSVVDPGVGTARRAVILKTKSGHFFVSPDNGTLGLVAQSLGIDEVREIDVEKNSRPGSENSYTFQGRDLFAYTAARLASGKIGFEDVGKKLADSVVTIKHQQPIAENGLIKGNIPVLDIQYGNVWTNIPGSLIFESGIKYGDSLWVEILKNDSIVYREKVSLQKTFGEVSEGASLAYLNSLMNFSLAINQGNFSERHHIYSGPEWVVVVNREL